VKRSKNKQSSKGTKEAKEKATHIQLYPPVVRKGKPTTALRKENGRKQVRRKEVARRAWAAQARGLERARGLFRPKTIESKKRERKREIKDKGPNKKLTDNSRMRLHKGKNRRRGIGGRV